jgi:hypothetical protein
MWDDGEGSEVVAEASADATLVRGERHGSARGSTDRTPRGQNHRRDVTLTRFFG